MTEKLENIIAGFVQKLHFGWFYQKEISFKSDNNYVDSQNEIRIVQKRSFTTHSLDIPAQDGNPPIYSQNWVEMEEIHCFDLRKFCSAYLPLDDDTNWGTTPSSEEYKPSLANTLGLNYSTARIATDLINDIAEILFSGATAKETYDFVKLSNQILHKEVAKLREKNTQIIYNQVLDDFEIRINSLLHRKYEKELLTSAISFQTDDKLEFNVGQEQLAALLAILDEAKILKIGNTAKEQQKFFEFCQRYFYFTLNKKAKRSETVKTFRDKFKEAKNAINDSRKTLSPLKKISNTLLAAIPRR